MPLPPSKPPPPSIAALQSLLATRLARLLDVDPDLRDAAVELGIIDRNWLDQPGEHKLSTAPPLEVTRRLLEKKVERKPSAFATLGLKAIDMLSWDVSWNRSPDTADDTTAEATVVFTDLEGFTRFTSDEGDTAALALLDEHQKVVMPIVRGWNGRLVKKIGDGRMLVFGNPSDAVHAAVELADSNAGPLAVRAGVNSGLAVITRDDVLGHVVNVAARVTDEANGGEALVTASVFVAVEGIANVGFTGPMTRPLKGIDTPMVLYRARGL